MATNPQDVSSFDGLFKDQFHNNYETLIPDHTILQKDGFIDWVDGDKMNGELYSIPTILRSNQGVSYLGESGGAATLNDAQPGVMKEAQIKGSEMVVRGQITYGALSRASSKGPKAFAKASGILVEDLAQVAHTRIEIAALYGQDSLGVLASDPTNTSGSIWTMVITDDSWAPGMWVLLEGAVLEFYDTSGTLMGASTTFTLGGVDTANKKLTTTKSGSATLEAGDTLHFQGARTGTSTWNEMVGLYKQFSDVSSVMFNLPARSGYSLLQPSVYSSTGAITKAKILEAGMRLVDKGCMSPLTVLVGTKAWAALAAEDLALRMFDSSYSSSVSKSGSEAFEYTSVNGKISVVCHPFVKGGHAFLFNPDEVLWIGSSKPTFELPSFNEQFFQYVPNTNCVELQNYSDLAVYAIKPCQTGVMTGITYT